MNSEQTIFSQLMDLIPYYEFHKCVERYKGKYKIKSFSCWDQFLCMAFAQLTFRESLRASQQKLYHMGFRGNIPALVIIAQGKVHDVNIIDYILLEAGAIYIMDRGDMDFSRLYKIHQSSAFFITRAKRNMKFKRIYSHIIDRTTGLQCGQITVLKGFYAKQDYPDKLRRIRYFDVCFGRNCQKRAEN